jgi:hypothetical protein
VIDLIANLLTLLGTALTTFIIKRAFDTINVILQVSWPAESLKDKEPIGKSSQHHGGGSKAILVETDR